MKKVLVITENAYLGQKIKLALIDRADVVISRGFAKGYDTYFLDLDTVNLSVADAVTMSRTKVCDLKIPFLFDTLYESVSDRNIGNAISLSGRICRLRDEEIRLTELEAKLLSVLVSANGEFVSRDEILSNVWGNEAEAGIINVYIHYLREKIECGEKIILSSRKQGYRIDKKYLAEVDNA